MKLSAVSIPEEPSEANLKPVLAGLMAVYKNLEDDRVGLGITWTDTVPPEALECFKQANATFIFDNGNGVFLIGYKEETAYASDPIFLVKASPK